MPSVSCHARRSSPRCRRRLVRSRTNVGWNRRAGRSAPALDHRAAAACRWRTCRDCQTADDDAGAARRVACRGCVRGGVCSRRGGHAGRRSVDLAGRRTAAASGRCGDRLRTQVGPDLRDRHGGTVQRIAAHAAAHGWSACNHRSCCCSSQQSQRPVRAGRRWDGCSPLWLSSR